MQINLEVMYYMYESPFLNSLRSYIRQYSIIILPQIMACPLLGAIPLPETMLSYYQLEPAEYIFRWIFTKCKSCHSKLHLKISSTTWLSFCLGLNVLSTSLEAINVLHNRLKQTRFILVINQMMMHNWCSRKVVSYIFDLLVSHPRLI